MRKERALQTSVRLPGEEIVHHRKRGREYDDVQVFQNQETKQEIEVNDNTVVTIAQDEGKDRDDGRHWLRAWAWKREHRPDKARFQRPYMYPLGKSFTSLGYSKLRIQQAPFNAEGFASTIWDSSIVVSKYLERHPDLVKGCKCLDLSAGCGLVALVMKLTQQLSLETAIIDNENSVERKIANNSVYAKCDGFVVATDLAPNLNLLKKNCNQIDFPVTVHEYTWGQDASHLDGPFDLVVACDTMYIDELTSLLVQSLKILVRRARKHGGTAIVAYGRNRGGEASFMKISREAGFRIDEVPTYQLDPLYNCVDVTVLKLTWIETDN